MGSKQAQADDELEEMLLAFQDKLICGVYEAIYDLDEASLDTIMLCQAQACMATFLDFTGLTSPMPLDSLQDAMRNARPFGADIRQEGNVIYWTGNERGHCVCPLVRRGVVRLDPKLCICGACWVKHLFEKVGHTPVDVEVVETVATGGQACRYKITFNRGLGVGRAVEGLHPLRTSTWSSMPS